MSVIAAVRKARRLVIAADSQDNFGDLRPPPDNHSALKIRAIGDAWLGCSGWAVYDDLFGHYLQKKSTRASLNSREDIFEFFLKFWRIIRSDYPFVNEQSRSEDKTPFADLDATFLIASPGGIFLVSSNMSVSRFEKYYAIGSGGDYALGALHALYDEKSDAIDLAERAIAAAKAYDSGCGGATVTKEITLKGAK
jgi:ATP-dependent HslUV protease, peptidase subunit HslV